MTNRVTMSDIARQAGVSLMTVSRVINHKADVSPDTRRRVEQIIKELEYRPSAIARSLATQETRSIGLVIPDVTNPFFADITLGIEPLAYAQGYHVFLCNTGEDPQRELSLIQSLDEKQVDGLILCSSRLDENLLTNLLTRLPATVLINRKLNINGHDIEGILLDDVGSGQAATQHLINTGHQKIGYLAGPSNSYSALERKRGYLAAMQSAGITPPPGWIVPCRATVEGGYNSSLELLEQHPELTGLFCYNDLIAVGALQACAILNIQVPNDLAIIGHDDIPFASMVSPTLTTCRVHRHELGVQAVTLLMERLKGCATGCHSVIVPYELVIRQSAPQETNSGKEVKANFISLPTRADSSY